MKAEKIGKPFAAFFLAMVISRSAAGCLATGFALRTESPEILWVVCGLAALAGSLCLLFRWGFAAVLCLLALWTGYLWRQGAALQQILQLLYRISYTYDGAYGWGVLRFVDTPWNAGAADIPLQILGAAIALVVCFAVCRGKRTWPAVAVSVIPLLLCLVVTDTVPSERWLFGLLLGLLLLVLTASVRKNSPEQAAALAWMLALPLAAALWGLFLLIPKEDYVNKSEEIRESILTFVESLPETVEDVTREVASAVDTGEDASVNLKTLGRQNSLAYPVMEVTSDRGGVEYLRQQDYDSYTGTGWTASRIRSEEFACTGEDAGQVQIRTRTGQESRFLPYYPGEEVTLIGGSLENPGREKDYCVQRRVLPDNWRELVRQRSQGIWESEIVFTAALEASSYLDANRYLLLPLETENWAKELLVTVLSGEGSATDKADTIAAYVRSSAEYDRDTQRMDPEAEDFVRWFLEDSDTGYCVHFATAAVVLLRAADIPARYVTGYMVTCQPGETVTVTADTAHAWAEYYEPQLACWIPLEATPSDGLPQTGGTREETIPLTEPEQPGETRPQTEPEMTVPSRTEENREPEVQAAPKKQLRIPTGLVVAVLLVILTVAQRPVRLALRRQRQERGSPNDRALALWRECVLLARLRQEPVPGRIKALAQKAKFSQHTLTGEELAELENYRSCSVEVLETRPWYSRLVYRYVFAAY